MHQVLIITFFCFGFVVIFIVLMSVLKFPVRDRTIYGENVLTKSSRLELFAVSSRPRELLVKIAHCAGVQKEIIEQI